MAENSTHDDQQSKPTLRPPRPDQLIAIVRFIAEQSDLIVLTDHAMERMDERGIVDVDVFRILRQGCIVGPIEPGRGKGDWVVKIVNRIKGSRDAGVICAVIRDKQLIVITVEWEDIK